MSGLFTRGWLVLALVACNSTRTTTPPPTPAAETPAPAPVEEPEQPQPMEETAELDQTFLDEMIPHHRQGVKMAALAENRAEHPELKELAAQIRETQVREIDMMQEWRTRWYGAEAEPGDLPVNHMPPHELPMGTGAASAETPGAPGTPGSMDTTGTTGTTGTGELPGATQAGEVGVTALENLQGEAFDQMFLGMMIPHHEEGLKMIEEVSGRTVHPEMDQLLDQMSTAHRAEIATMKQWQAAWTSRTSH